MSLPNRVVVSAIALVSLALLAACGSSSPKVTPPPTGGFSRSNLNGTYVFSVVGSDSILGDFQAVAGTLTADGNGNITGGTFDLNNPNNAGVNLGLTVAGGSTYTVSQDGRGTATIKVSGGTFGFDFVLTSKVGGGLITEFDGNGTGSGTLELQSSTSLAAGSYTFNLTGTSGVNTSICGDSSGSNFVIPFATVGTFTVDSSGNVSSGIEDVNNDCFSTFGTNGSAITGGSITAAPGASTLVSAAGTFQFHVYPVDATHVKFIEIDGLPVVAGDAFTQTSSIPTNNVFAVAGFDIPAFGPFTAVGLLVTDGNGNVTSSSAEDINDFSATSLSGVYSEVTGYTGSYTTLSGGRSLLTLTGFANGNGGLTCGSSGTASCQFAIYPSSGGLQVLEVDGTGITSGVAYAQSGTPTLASAQGYGMNLSGANLSVGGEEDDIAEFKDNGGTFTGIIDFNDQGTTIFDQGFTSTYTADSTVSGRGTVAATGSKTAYDLVIYGIDGASSVAVVADSNMIALGSVGLQNATVNANAAMRHLSTLRLEPRTAKSLKIKRSTR